MVFEHIKYVLSLKSKPKLPKTGIDLLRTSYVSVWSINKRFILFSLLYNQMNNGRICGWKKKHRNYLLHKTMCLVLTITVFMLCVRFFTIFGIQCFYISVWIFFGVANCLFNGIIIGASARVLYFRSSISTHRNITR